MENKVSVTRNVLLFGVALPIGLGLAYFGIVRPILIKLNIIDSRDERLGNEAKERLTKSQVLSPQLYLDNRGKVTIDSSRASSLAQQIYKGKWGGCGGFCDDETKAVGSIQNAGSLINISYIAYQFNQIYKQGMESFMNSYLEPENWLTIQSYIEKTDKY